MARKIFRERQRLFGDGYPVFQHQRTFGLTCKSIWVRLFYLWSTFKCALYRGLRTMPAAERTSSFAPCRAAFWQALVSLSVGALFWGPLIYFVPRDSVFHNRLTLLQIVMGNQAGCLLVGIVRRTCPLRGFGKIDPENPGVERIPTKSLLLHTLRVAVLGMSLAVVLGIIYDMLLWAAFGNDAPTIGPWGAARFVQPLAAGFIVAFGVSLGPLGDEYFFLAGIFRALGGCRCSSARRPGFQPACSHFRDSTWSISPRTSDWDSCFAPSTIARIPCSPLWATHILLNAAMFALLFNGYQ